MTTPTQIATKSMKGCGNYINKEFSANKCYKNCLCSKCISIILIHKQDWEGELEKIGRYRKLIPFEERMLYEMMTRDMMELTQSLKILEGRE